MRPRILVTDKIHEAAIEEAKKFAEVDLAYGIPSEELKNKISRYDALIVRSRTKVTREIIENAKNLKIIGRAGVGLDNIDLKAAKEKGIKVVNSPEASTISVAELTIGSLIALLRKIPEAHFSVKSGKWEREKFMGNELYGKTLGIIGFGRIGREVALRANAFGMKVLVYDPNITEEDAKEYNCHYTPFEELLASADIITLHVPLTDKTRGLINASRIKLMKDNAILLNFSRGEVVDEEALYKALKDGKLKGAALDVFSKEPPKSSKLLELDNVVLTPHIGASTEEAQLEAGLVVVEKIRNFFSEKWG